MGTRYEESDGSVRGLTPGDFAILMRSTRVSEQNDSPRHAAFTQALEARGIPYSLEAGGGVFDRPQVSVLRDTFELLRNDSPSRERAEQHFNNVVLPAFPLANFDRFTHVLADWGRLIHAPVTGTRRRVYPQQLVHDLLSTFRVDEADFDDGIMRDLGVFSKIIQDVEAVYLSVDTTQRFREILNFLGNVADTGYDTSTDDVLQRPDAVTVSTVHRVKGLEFPVVFLADVEAQRFPKNRRAYSGWLPSEVIQPALNRGAYQSTPAEKLACITLLSRGQSATSTSRVAPISLVAHVRGSPHDFHNDLRIQRFLTIEAHFRPDLHCIHRYLESTTLSCQQAIQIFGIIYVARRITGLGRVSVLAHQYLSCSVSG